MDATQEISPDDVEPLALASGVLDCDGTAFTIERIFACHFCISVG